MAYATSINITTEGRPLTRITFDGHEVTLESNLDENASAKAIGDAMEELGRSIGPDAEVQARTEVADLRAQEARVQDFVQALIQMVMEGFANIRPPEINLPLKEWRSARAN